MKTNLLGKKVYKLQKLLRELKSVVVAYSGGVDSTFLLYAARRVLGKPNVLAVIAQSPTYPGAELRSAKKIAKILDANYTVIKTDELSSKNFRSNPQNRCYHCKKELFAKLTEIAKDKGYRYVLDGTNDDDRRDHRPGDRAARELKVKRPLAEVKLKKEEIRRLSKALSLPTYNKPQQACLASRVPYFEEITQEKLNRIERAESYLRKFGFTDLRVRDHSGVARIELNGGNVKMFLDENLRKQVVRRLKSLGFAFVCVDLEGYRPGSLNRLLEKS